MCTKTNHSAGRCSCHIHLNILQKTHEATRHEWWSAEHHRAPLMRLLIGRCWYFQQKEAVWFYFSFNTRNSVNMQTAACCCSWKKKHAPSVQNSLLIVLLLCRANVLLRAPNLRCSSAMQEYKITTPTLQNKPANSTKLSVSLNLKTSMNVST